MKSSIGNSKSDSEYIKMIAIISICDWTHCMLLDLNCTFGYELITVVLKYDNVFLTVDMINK